MHYESYIGFECYKVQLIDKVVLRIEGGSGCRLQHHVPTSTVMYQNKKQTFTC